MSDEPTLESDPAAMDKLIAVQTAVEEWHAQQKLEILGEVLFLRTLQSPIEAVANTYFQDIANQAMEVLDSIQLEGPESPDPESLT